MVLRWRSLQGTSAYKIFYRTTYMKYCIKFYTRWYSVIISTHFLRLQFVHNMNTTHTYLWCRIYLRMCHTNQRKTFPTLPGNCPLPGPACSRLPVCLRYGPISISPRLLHLPSTLLPGSRPQHPPDCSIYLYLLCWSLRQRVNWIY